MRVNLAAAAMALAFAGAVTAVNAVLLVYATRRIARWEAARPGSAQMFGPVVPIVYALLVIGMPCGPLSWPVTVAVGVWMLNRAHLARQGRITLAAAAVWTVTPAWVLALVLLERAAR